MLKRIIKSLITIAFTMAFISIGFAQMEKGKLPKTSTLPSGEVVCNLNGDWKVFVELYGSLGTFEKYTVKVRVTQEGNKFLGVKLTGSRFIGEGMETIRGELGQNGFKNVQLLHLADGWIDCKGELSFDCNKILLDDGRWKKMMLERE